MDRIRYILYISKGLIRFHSFTYKTLEFIHKLVQEFILDKDSIVLRMYSAQSGDALKAPSH